MQTEGLAAASSDHVMTSDSIAAYLQYERDRGVSADALRNFRRVTGSLYEWLPEDKVITRKQLLAWRQSLKDHGYTAQTQENYVKGINRYLDYAGCSDIRFNRGRAKDLAGKQFGYLTAIEPTGAKYRKDIVWRCLCKCGREAEYPATRLLTGNTVSCGCLRGEHLRSVNMYCGGTSLRQSMKEQIHSTQSQSGYTGVTIKRGKWAAYIKYKGKHISLGSYTNLEDAVKARARGKELVQMDAMGLLDVYEELHKDDPERPDRARVREQHREPKQEPPAASLLPAVRSNNTSGCPGVHRRRGKWSAKITHQKVTYQLGDYKTIEEAIAVRKEAEQALRQDPEGFPEWVLGRRQSGKQEILK